MTTVISLPRPPSQATNIDIEPYFEKDIKSDNSCKQECCIRVHLIQPAINNKRKAISCFIIKVTDSDFLLYDSESPDAPAVDFDWTPKSHMRDFEWISFSSLEQELVARGQGIGVIIIEPLQMYIKLVYDAATPFGVRVPGRYGMLWEHTPKTKRLLSCDLSIGYDVLLQTNDGNMHTLCESFDNRDTKETTILITDCKRYARYNHPQ